MARSGGRPNEETLTRAVEQLKRDGLAWATAEQDLLSARVKSTVKRVELAALMCVAALLVAIAGTIILATAAVQSLAASLGVITAGLVVGIALLLAGALLIVGAAALLRRTSSTGRARGAAKVLWSAMNDPN